MNDSRDLHQAHARAVEAAKGDAGNEYTTKPGRFSPFVVRTESAIEREKREAAFYLRVVWPEICGEENPCT